MSRPAYYNPPIMERNPDEMQTLCIISQIKIPTLTHLERARSCAFHAFRLIAKDWRIVVADQHGIDAEVMKTCITWEIPLLVCGTAARPTNGAPMKHYQRVVTGAATLIEKLVARDRFMAQLATEIVYFGPDVHPTALRLGKMPHWLYETETV